ncbi:Alpha/Beta hydrolase protein [Xylariaceae sp. FL1019]|nr:Alpha/Beta hydrolase protein [Xylariaceae sp. FL1019]
MDQIQAFGRGDVLFPTFGVYKDLLLAKESDIKSARRETHTYGPDPRHVLDLYLPEEQPTGPEKVLVWLYGGNFYAGDRVYEPYANGLMYTNLGRFFTRFGFTVIIPDYRLLSHGARYPSGGEDVKLVMDWIRDTLAAKEGYGDMNLFVLGNSAGAVHLSTFLFDPQFEEASENIIVSKGEGAGVRLRGVIFLGAPFHWGGQDDEHCRAYFGEDLVSERGPLGLLQAAYERGPCAKLESIEALIMVSELDPQILFDAAEDFKKVWKGGRVDQQILKGHNHISPPLGLCTGFEQEEAWGFQVVEWVNSRISR